LLIVAISNNPDAQIIHVVDIALVCDLFAAAQP
jgi:electron transfer flavoprotein alpha subunit